MRLTAGPELPICMRPRHPATLRSRAPSVKNHVAARKPGRAATARSRTARSSEADATTAAAAARASPPLTGEGAGTSVSFGSSRSTHLTERADGSAAASGSEKPPWVDLALEEYKALRGEVLATMQTQGASLTFGTATLGIVAAGAFNVWKEQFIATIVFMFVVLFVCSLVLVVWLGELTRMMRAGQHLFGLEKALQTAFGIDPGGPVFSWESHLRSGSTSPTEHPSMRQFGWNYAAIIWMFLSIAVGSVFLGMWRGTHAVPHDFPLSRDQVRLAAFAMLLPLAAVLAFLWWHLHLACPHRFRWPRVGKQFALWARHGTP